MVLTTACDGTGTNEGRAVEQVVEQSATVHLMCAPVPTSPVLVFYHGGDAWFAARRTAEGAPLLLPSDASAATLGVWVTCPSFREDRCIECGRYTPLEAHLTAMRCPLGKWPVAQDRLVSHRA